MKTVRNTDSDTEDATTPARAGSEAVARVLEAAEALFSESGFDGVSMNAIAAAAGVSKANIFHHFSSKKELYLAVVRAACRDSSERLQRFDGTSGPFAQRLGAFAQGMLSGMLEQEQVQRLILRELLKDGEQRGREFAEQVFGDSFARLVGILRAGQRRGELRREVDPAMVATLLIGASVFFFEARAVLRHFPDVSYADDPERYSMLLTDILLRGIGAGKES